MVEHRFLIRLEKLGPHRRAQVPFGEDRRALEPDDVAAF
jgi:hypothetical protein